MIEHPYFIMKSSLPSGDYAQLFVPSSIDRDSLYLLRKLIDLQLGAVERRIERQDAIEAALASPQAPVSPDEGEGR